MKLVVFIPALNEAKTIGEALDRIPKKIPGVDQIVKMVIDDGSTDDTIKIAKQHGAIVYSNNSQKRVSYTFQKGIRHALEMGADVAVNIDADLQFKPEQIPDLVEPIVQGEADFVVGDRFTDPETLERRKPENMPGGKYLANRVGSWVVGVLSKRKFRDVTCGFRAYSREAMLTLNIQQQYTYTQESFQMLALKKFEIKMIPVEIKYFSGRKSRVVTNFTGFLFGSGLNILKTFRDHAPLQFFGILGTFLFALGLIVDTFVVYHFITTGGFSPYIFLAFIGVYLNTMGIIVWIVGLVADMLDRIRNNQERILYLLKEVRYGEYREPQSNS